MLKSNKSKLPVILVLIAVLLLGACGGPAQNPDSGAETNAVTESETGETSPAEAVASDGERIVRMSGAFPLIIDPGVGSNGIEAAVQFNIYDALVFPDIDGTIMAHVAEDWDVSEDGLTYTFELRQDIKFHDGSNLTASDVAFSMNRLLALGEGFAYLYVPCVEEAVATGEYTVEMRMKQTFGPFVASLVRFAILNEDLVMANLKDGPYGEFGDYGKDYLITHDAGSGPYMVTDIKVDEYMHSVRFEDYWQEFPENSPEGFEALSASDPATIRTLMSRRELDITDEWQAMETLNMLDEIDGVDVTNMYCGAIANIEFNTKKAPTDDVHFRKALAYCLDYEAGTTSIYPGTKQAVGPVSAAYAGHDPDLFQYTQDFEKAKEELAQSAYADDFGDYTVEMIWTPEAPDQEKWCLLLQQNAAQIGINIEIVKTPLGNLIANAANVETTPHITVIYPSDSYAEAGAVLNLRYHSATAGTFQQAEWLQDPEIDAAIEASLAEVDTEKRLEMYKEIQRDLVELCPSIWALEWPEMRAYQSDYLYWPEAEAGASGGVNAPIMGRSVYVRTMQFKN